MEKSYISSVARIPTSRGSRSWGVPNEIGTSFKVFSLLAQHGINVDIILQGIGHAEGRTSCFLPWRSRTWSWRAARGENKAHPLRGLETNADVAKVSVVGAGVIQPRRGGSCSRPSTTRASTSI